jgi:hypothetical protein
MGGDSWREGGSARQPPQPATPRPFVPPQPGEPDCPKCGSGMRLRFARYGRRRGKHFWGCSRFPDCNGTRRKREGTERAKQCSLDLNSEN